MKRVAIVLNGEPPEGYLVKKFKESNYDYVITADGAYDFCEENDIKVDVVVGDFDSTKMSRLEIEKKTNVLSFPKEKDNTDGELSVELALSLSPLSIDIYGAGGKREDHFIGNLNLLHRIAKEGINVVMINNKSYVYMTKKKLELNDVLGLTISLIPYTDCAYIDNTEGLAYPLNNFELLKTSTLGISNIAKENKVKIRIRQGFLMVFVNHSDVL